MSERALVSRSTMEVVTALATMAIGGAVMWGAVEHDIGWGDSGPAAGYFPFRLGVLIVLGSLANLWLALRRRSDDTSVFLTREQGKRVLAFGLPIVGFVIVSLWLGLYVAAILYLFLVMVFQGGYRPLFAIAVAVGFAVVMRLVFPMWFKVPLLTGPLEAMLGLY
ncbi:MAG TPA: tripartite tricarboxylate transporter TctB family protein [Beijerinckiaceae bacterium]|nr:tripartite tricarboxylate transporter TctB family protein [Beijerinckiaceae bacterium]